MFELNDNNVHAYMDTMITRTRVILSETDMYNAIIHTERLEFEVTKKETNTNLNYSALQPVCFIFIVSHPCIRSNACSIVPTYSTRTELFL